MLALRPIAYVLLAGLLAAARSTATTIASGTRPTHRTRSSRAALDACGPESRVGSVEGNTDPRTYFEGPATPEQTTANRLFQRCMVAEGGGRSSPRCERRRRGLGARVLQGLEDLVRAQ